MKRAASHRTAGLLIVAGAAAVGIGVLAADWMWGHPDPAQGAATRPKKQAVSTRGDPKPADIGVTISPARAQRKSAVQDNVADITFPNGSTFSVRFHELPPLFSFQGAKGRLSEFYSGLRSLAESGDAPASFALHHLLEQCRASYPDESSLNNAINTLRTDGVLKWPNDTRPSVRISDRTQIPEIERVALREPHEFCSGTTATQIAESDMWLRNAADAGEFWSRQERAVNLGNTPEAIEEWKSLWKDGHYAALPALSIYLQKGVYGGEPDYLNAYAYNYIQYKLIEAAYRTGNAGVDLTEVIEVEATVRRSAGFLTPEQNEAALKLAENLMRESPNCCSGVR